MANGQESERKDFTSSDPGTCEAKESCKTTEECKNACSRFKDEHPTAFWMLTGGLIAAGVLIGVLFS
jgi:hypothetical protein